MHPYSVYILRSVQNPYRYYTGMTANLEVRIKEHNEGRCKHTSSGKPWIVIVSINFADRLRAIQFERYLKSGSGSAFARRHLR